MVIKTLNMEKNFVIEASDRYLMENMILSHYGDDVSISSKDNLCDINISSTSANWYINVIENKFYEKEFPKSFTTKASNTFSSPLYFYFSANNDLKGIEFFNIIKIKKMFYNEV